jgi:hypothetical protein
MCLWHVSRRRDARAVWSGLVQEAISLMQIFDDERSRSFEVLCCTATSSDPMVAQNVLIEFVGRVL